VAHGAALQTRLTWLAAARAFSGNETLAHASNPYTAHFARRESPMEACLENAQLDLRPSLDGPARDCVRPAGNRIARRLRQ
jgi:hypothetical protein